MNRNWERVTRPFSVRDLTTDGGPARALRVTDWGQRSTSVRFHGPDARVEVCLALAFAGEDVVVTRVETVKGRFDFGPTTAHKGHEMRKALDVQARQVADLLGIR